MSEEDIGRGRGKERGAGGEGEGEGEKQGERERERERERMAERERERAKETWERYFVLTYCYAQTTEALRHTTLRPCDILIFPP
jgi:hypothetical protein